MGLGGEKALGVVRREEGLAVLGEDFISLFRREVDATRGSVGRVSEPRCVVELEIEFREEHGPAGLPTVECLRRHEVGEVFMRPRRWG